MATDKLFFADLNIWCNICSSMLKVHQNEINWAMLDKITQSILNSIKIFTESPLLSDGIAETTGDNNFIHNFASDLDNLSNNIKDKNIIKSKQTIHKIECNIMNVLG